MALMLTGPDNQVLATYVFTTWLRGDLNFTAAIGVIMVLAMGILFLIVEKLTTARMNVGGFS